MSATRGNVGSNADQSPDESSGGGEYGAATKPDVPPPYAKMQRASETDRIKHSLAGILPSRLAARRRSGFADKKASPGEARLRTTCDRPGRTTNQLFAPAASGATSAAGFAALFAEADFPAGDFPAATFSAWMTAARSFSLIAIAALPVRRRR